MRMEAVRGTPKGERDPEKLRELMRKIQAACERDGTFKGMTEEQILQKMRATREAVWQELKDAAGSRR